MRDAANSGPEKQVLVAGNIVMMLLLPVVRQASITFSGHLRLVAVLVGTAQAIVSLLMLLGRMAAKRKLTQKKCAARLAVALRGGIL